MAAIFPLIPYEPLTSLPRFRIRQNGYISSLLVYSQSEILTCRNKIYFILPRLWPRMWPDFAALALKINACGLYVPQFSPELNSKCALIWIMFQNILAIVKAMWGCARVVVVAEAKAFPFHLLFSSYGWHQQRHIRSKNTRTWSQKSATSGRHQKFLGHGKARIREFKGMTLVPWNFPIKCNNY